MKIKYYPGKYLESIPLTVTKHIDQYHREGSTLKIAVTGREEPDSIDLDNIREIIAKKLRQGVSVVSYGLLEVLFIFAVINAFQREFSLYSIYLVVMGTFLISFVAYMIKSNLERYMHGGFTCPLGEIYFQSDEERAQFGDALGNMGRKKKTIKKQEENGDEE